MAPSNEYDTAKGNTEHILELEGGRQIAYAHNGPPSARTVVLFFVGLFGIGKAGDVPEPLRNIHARWITPTIPGQGDSSPRAPGEPYHLALAKDISALLDHLYPTGDFDALYLSGGSYGTVHAQMLYGAPYDIFPAGRKIAGCLLVAGFAPHYYHTDYAKDLTWQNWFSIGPPTQLVPFHMLQRLVSSIIAVKLKTLEGAKDFLRRTLFSKMDEHEKDMFAKHLAKTNKTEDDFVTALAEGSMKAYSKTWQGFNEVSDVLHSDWGFSPADLDEEHASKPVIVVGSEKDDMGGDTNKWLASNYKCSKLKVFPGGHISSLYYMDGLWQELLDWEM